jgi:hypothetical protein
MPAEQVVAKLKEQCKGNRVTLQKCFEVHDREQQIGGSGGSLEPPGPLS